MAIYVRPFVTSIAHVEGCPKRNCGPSCARRTNGWEYHLKLVLPNGEFFEERKKSPVAGKTGTQRYAEARAAHVVRESVAPAPVVKKEVPTVSGFRESFMTYSKTNNKPSTVYAKEGILNAHLIPFFGRMRMDAIGPAEIERYKAAKLESGLQRKSINGHLTPDVRREAVRLLDRTDAGPGLPGPAYEKPGDIRETEEAEKENPRGHRGLDGAGKEI